MKPGTADDGRTASRAPNCPHVAGCTARLPKHEFGKRRRVQRSRSEDRPGRSSQGRAGPVHPGLPACAFGPAQVRTRLRRIKHRRACFARRPSMAGRSSELFRVRNAHQCKSSANRARFSGKSRGSASIAAVTARQQAEPSLGMVRHDRQYAGGDEHPLDSRSSARLPGAVVPAGHQPGWRPCPPQHHAGRLCRVRGGGGGVAKVVEIRKRRSLQFGTNQNTAPASAEETTRCATRPPLHRLCRN